MSFEKDHVQIQKTIIEYRFHISFPTLRHDNILDIITDSLMP